MALTPGIHREFPVADLNSIQEAKLSLGSVVELRGGPMGLAPLKDQVAPSKHLV